jgi:hypothetical protein
MKALKDNADFSKPLDPVLFIGEAGVKGAGYLHRPVYRTL